jgi:hypothetical protein
MSTAIAHSLRATNTLALLADLWYSRARVKLK